MAKRNKDNSKKALDGFTPSTGNESYLQTGTADEKWVHVKELWSESRKHAEQAVEMFMDMGDILVVLREGKSDPVFGNLRKKHCPELSRQDATRAMNMARNRTRFPTESTKALPSISVFAELIHSSDELVEEVIAKTADPEEKTPTVKEVRKAAKEEKEPESAEEFANSLVDLNDGIEPDDSLVGDDDLVEDDESTDIGQPPLAIWVEQMLEKPLKQRINELRDEEFDTVNALVLLGFNPLYDGDYPCTKQIFLLVISHYLEVSSEEDSRIANDCAKIIERELWS